MAQNIAEFKKQQEQRRSRLQAVGLRPYQMALTVGVCIYLLFAIGKVVYLLMEGYQESLRLRMLVRPAVVVILWMLQRSCYANIFAVVSACSGFMALQQVATLRSDYFAVASVLGLLALSAASGILWLRTRRDPVFRAEEKSADERAG